MIHIFNPCNFILKLEMKLSKRSLLLTLGGAPTKIKSENL